MVAFFSRNRLGGVRPCVKNKLVRCLYFEDWLGVVRDDGLTICLPLVISLPQAVRLDIVRIPNPV